MDTILSDSGVTGFARSAPTDADAREKVWVRARARWWPQNALDPAWRAAMRRAGLEIKDVARARAAVTADHVRHEFDTQTAAALRTHWCRVRTMVGQSARDRWRVLASAVRVTGPPMAGDEDEWLRGDIDEFSTPIADAERVYYRLRLVRCAYSVDDRADGRVLVLPLALVREDPVMRRHILLGLCCLEARASIDVAILGRVAHAPPPAPRASRARWMRRPSERPSAPPPNAAAVELLSSHAPEVEPEGVEAVPRVAGVIEFVLPDSQNKDAVDDEEERMMGAIDGRLDEVFGNGAWTPVALTPVAFATTGADDWALPWNAQWNAHSLTWRSDLLGTPVPTIYTRDGTSDEQ